MNVNNKLSSNPQAIANAFNTYFLSVAENLLTKNFPGKNTTNYWFQSNLLTLNFNKTTFLKFLTKKKIKKSKFKLLLQ